MKINLNDGIYSTETGFFRYEFKFLENSECIRLVIIFKPFYKYICNAIFTPKDKKPKTVVKALKLIKGE